MTIARRLTLLLAVPLILLTGLGLLVRNQIDRIGGLDRFVIDLQIPSLAKLGDISRASAEMRNDIRTYLMSENAADQAQILARYRQNQATLKTLLTEYADNLISNEKDHRLYAEYRDLMRQWSAESEKPIALAEAGQRKEAIAAFFSSSIPQLGLRTGEVLGEWIRHNETLAKDTGASTLLAVAEARRNLLIAFVFVIALAGFLGFHTFQRIVLPIRALQKSVESIAAGDYVHAVPFTRGTDETGALARSIDVLKWGAAAMEDQRWVKANVAKLSAGLQGAASHAEFGQRLLSGLVPVLGGGAAVLFVREKDPTRLRRVASYGLAENAELQDSLVLGEGLSGQCARDGVSTALTDLPPDYLRISCGLGGAAPVRAVAWPVASQSALLGVLEFASFGALRPSETALMEELLPVVAMSLEVLSHNLATEELLEQTQQQAHQLEAQNEAASRRARFDAMYSDVGAALVKLQDFPSTMKSCAEAMLRGVDSALARIWMLEPDTDTLVLCASAGLTTDLHGSRARLKVGIAKLAG